MRKPRTAATLLLAGSLALIATGASAEGMGTPADLAENFPAPDAGLLQPDNATITRSDEGVHLHLDLVTPEAGSYTYPENIPAEAQAQPEVFTGWAFVFNYPENCETPFDCGAADFEGAAKGGVYNFGGFSNSLSQSGGGEIALNGATDGYVRLVGDILVGQEQRSDLPPETTTFALENPMGAEIHAAIAPHGQFDAETIADELYNPTGSPACSCWWVAVFEGAGAGDDMASN